MSEPTFPAASVLGEAVGMLEQEEPGSALGLDAEYFGIQEEEKEQAIPDDQELPGEGKELSLTDTEKQQLCQELLECLSLYDQSMQGRWEREQEIESNYAMAADPQQGGSATDSERLASELTMSQVDQADARITENILGAEPWIKVDPVIESADTDQMKRVKELAEATERFINNFALFDMKLNRKLPVAVHRSCKVGTAVLLPRWVKREKTRKSIDHKSGELVEETTTIGGIEISMPANRNIVCWPPTLADWQEAAIVGHREWLTKAEFRSWARVALKMTEEEIRQVESVQDADTDRGAAEKSAETFGIEPDAQLHDSIGQIKITELYCYLALPGDFEASRFHVILSEDRQKILYVGPNKFFCDKHPYFPVRYKVIDESSWGLGIGDEVMYAHAADSALRNLQIDNLMGGAYNIHFVRAGTAAQVLMDRPVPNQVVPTDNPESDFSSVQLGGKAEGIDDAIQDNRFRGRETTGLAPVLGGQGDPTLKSGAGTGSTMALIEQAGKKFGNVDRTMRTDLGDFMQFVLELCTQYGTDGLTYRYVSDEDADIVNLAKYQSVRGVVEENLRIRATAPNAATSKEALQNKALISWQFINQHYQQMLMMAQQVYADNPAGFMTWQQDVVVFLDKFAKDILRYQDIPGLADLAPALPRKTPENERINQLMQQLQQMEMQMQQMAQQAQQAQPMQMGGVS